jgi:murein DD-endopeptidase MepM/ murein hydrolase activator NlpD
MTGDPSQLGVRSIGGLLACTLLIWHEAASATAHTPSNSGAAATESTARQAERGRCREGALPDDGVCVPLPRDGEENPLAVAAANVHREKNGHLRAYEQIPRRPERPERYDAYRYPIPPGLPGNQYVISGYDLDRPDGAQRRGPRLRAVGHGGVDLPQARGTPIKLVALEHQQGDAEVLYVGPLFGTTVLTRHPVREGGALQNYVVLFGHLADAAPDLTPGRMLEDGHIVGSVGDTGSPELVHLHLEIRRAREGVDLVQAVREGGGGRILSEVVTVVTDPRNLLPLAGPRVPVFPRN